MIATSPATTKPAAINFRPTCVMRACGADVIGFCRLRAAKTGGNNRKRHNKGAHTSSFSHLTHAHARHLMTLLDRLAIMRAFFEQLHIGLNVWVAWVELERFAQRLLRARVVAAQDV